MSPFLKSLAAGQGPRPTRVNVGPDAVLRGAGPALGGRARRPGLVVRSSSIASHGVRERIPVKGGGSMGIRIAALVSLLLITGCDGSESPVFPPGDGALP